jgi:hypothetical protein
MDLILAIEPDDAQAAVLGRMLPDRVGAELLVVSTAEAGVAALDRRVPDVLLVGRDAPADAIERLVAALSANGLVPQQLPVPELRIEEETPRKAWRLPFGRTRQVAAVAEGWDPTLFAEQVATCLDKARRNRESSSAVMRSAAAAEGPLGQPAQPPATDDANEPHLHYAGDASGVSLPALRRETAGWTDTVPAAAASPFIRTEVPETRTLAGGDPPVEALGPLHQVRTAGDEWSLPSPDAGPPSSPAVGWEPPSEPSSPAPVAWGDEWSLPSSDAEPSPSPAVGWEPSSGPPSEPSSPAPVAWGDEWSLPSPDAEPSPSPAVGWEPPSEPSSSAPVAWGDEWSLPSPDAEPSPSPAVEWEIPSEPPIEPPTPVQTGWGGAWSLPSLDASLSSSSSPGTEAPIEPIGWSGDAPAADSGRWPDPVPDDGAGPAPSWPAEDVSAEPAVTRPFEWPSHVDTTSVAFPGTALDTALDDQPAEPIEDGEAESARMRWTADSLGDLEAFDLEPEQPAASEGRARDLSSLDEAFVLGDAHVLDVSSGEDGVTSFWSESPAGAADFGDLEAVIRGLGVDGESGGTTPAFELLPTLSEDTDNPFASEGDADEEDEEFTLEFPEDAARAEGAGPAEDDSAWRPEGLIDPEFHAAELALVEVRAEARLAAEVERVKVEAAAQHAREVARLEAEAAAAREAAVLEAREAAEADARAALARELAAVRGEAEEKLVSELARVREDAAQSLSEQIGRTRAEADQMLEIELARAQAEAEAVRLAALEDARVAAESTAARALAAAVERVRAESDARLDAELARMRAETEEQRLAHEQAQREAEAQREQATREARAMADAEAAQRLAAEVGRLKAEAEERLAAELARVQLQAEAQRYAERQARLEAEHARDAASVEATLATEASAARALDLEIAQVRADAEARLQAELAQLRQEADEARRARDEAERRADEARDAVAREARQAAEDAAARSVADESARMREEAEARLAAETERARRDAEARLSAELAAFTADAERRRQHEIQELRRQMAQLRDAAVHEEMVRPGDVASTGGFITPWLEPAPEPRRPSLLHSQWPRKAAGAAVIVAVLSFVVDVPAVLRAGAMLVADRIGLDLGWDAEEDEFDIPILPPESPGPMPSAAAPRPSGASSSAPARRPSSPSVSPTTASGTLTVYSRIPLEVYDGTRRVGTSDGPMSLAPGWHELRLVSNRYNYRDDIAVEIRPGEAMSHNVTLPTGQLRVRSAPGAEVLVDGGVVGRAPFVEVDVPLGTREVVVRHPELGVRRATVEIRHQLPSELILPLDRAVDGPPAAPQLPPLSRRQGR